MEESVVPHVQEGLRIQLFGQTRAWLDGVEVDLGPMRQRTVFAWLALASGQSVSRDALAGILWGETPPPTATNTVQTYVKRLRQALEPARAARAKSDLLPSAGAGYALRVETDSVDVLHARRMIAAVRQAHAGADHHQVLTLATRALRGWSAPPLADLPLIAGHPRVVAMIEERWRAVGWAAEAAVALGRSAEVLHLLQEAALACPLDEAIQVALIRVYEAMGRRADAMDVYHAVRRRLANDLGVGPGTRLVAAYQDLLREPGTGPAPEPPQPPQPSVPTQLPAAVGHFTGRADALRTVESTCLATDGGARFCIVSGPGGVGKTALALEAAHRIRDRFPDGQLFVDLRADDPDGAVSTSDALTYLLRSLGVAQDQLPNEEIALVSLYRTLVDGRRVLIVLDNVATSSQVMSLLSPSPTSAVILTSRQTLASLLTQHAVTLVPLDGLPTDTALTLLAKIIGVERLADESDAARDIAQLCGGLPLALRIAAAKLAIRRNQPLREFANEISDERHRLSQLTLKGESRSVRTAFASAYRTLGPAAATAFQVMGLCPVTDFSPELIGALAGLDSHGRREVIDELMSAHLIAEDRSGRYRFHGLVRLYARERAEEGQSKAQLQALYDRLYDWYLAVLDAANGAIAVFRYEVGVPALVPGQALPFPEVAHAVLTFLEHERDNIPPLVRHAAQHGRGSSAWRLAYLMGSYYTNRGHGSDSIEVGTIALAAAHRTQDPDAVGLIHDYLGLAFLMTHRYAEGLDHLRQAVTLHRQAGRRHAEALVLRGLCLAYSLQRRYPEAIHCYETAYQLFMDLGQEHLAGRILSNRGDMYNAMGRTDLARRDLNEALSIARRQGNQRDEAITLTSLGEAGLRDGDPAAEDHLEQAFELHRAFGERRMEAETLRALGEASRRRGDHAGAVDRFHEALALHRQINDKQGEAITLGRIGRAYLDQHDVDLARLYLEQTVSMHGPAPAAHHEAQIHQDLGDLMALTNHTDDAVRHWVRALTLYRDAPEVRDAVAYLRSRIAAAGDFSRVEPVRSRVDLATGPWPGVRVRGSVHPSELGADQRDHRDDEVGGGRDEQPGAQTERCQDPAAEQAAQRNADPGDGHDEAEHRRLKMPRHPRVRHRVQDGIDRAERRPGRERDDHHDPDLVGDGHRDQPRGPADDEARREGGEPRHPRRDRGERHVADQRTEPERGGDQPERDR